MKKEYLNPQTCCLIIALESNVLQYVSPIIKGDGGGGKGDPGGHAPARW